MKKDPRDAYSQETQKHLNEVLWAAFYEPIQAIVDNPVARLNSGTSALLEAIRGGSIQYKNGTFTGTFNAKTSRELREFATFNKTTRSWTGNPPPGIKAEAILANDRRERLLTDIVNSIDGAKARVDQMIKTLSFGSDLPLFDMDADISEDLGIGIAPEMNPYIQKQLKAKYTKDLVRDIKNWTEEQTERLRTMVERLQIDGSETSLTENIMEEWGVTFRKARFLARQETNLFFSEYSLARARKAGIRKYRWSSSHDRRVRHRHNELDGEVISLDNPPIVDEKTGRRAHAGEDYQCRCQKIWILEERRENAIRRFIRSIPIWRAAA